MFTAFTIPVQELLVQIKIVLKCLSILLAALGLCWALVAQSQARVLLEVTLLRMARLVVLDDHLLFAVHNLIVRGEEPRRAAREIYILLRLLLTTLAPVVLTR